MVTWRATRSTSVRAEPQMTPKVSVFAPCALAATAARGKLVPLPAFNLRLVYGQHGIAELELARPGSDPEVPVRSLPVPL